MANYYDLMYQHYASPTSEEKELTDVVEDLMANGYQSYNVIVDGVYEKKMLIYEHTDPIDGKAIDMRAITLDTENIHLGNVIDRGDGRQFMAITQNDWNGSYNKYKVRELTDDIRFDLGTEVAMKCIVADKGLYDEMSYVNEANVFEDKDLRAVIVQYNEETSKLTLFDDVYIDNEHYRIAKIDNYTLKEYDDAFGVIQLVVVDTPFGTIFRNDDSEQLKGVMLTARVKDKILNSISRELYCGHNRMKRGDYITFTYDRDNQGTMDMEMYIAINKPSMETDYDKTLMYLCENVINLLNDKGEVVKMPLYFEDNRTRIDKESDSEYIRIKGSSYLITLQDNSITQKLTHKVNRVIIKDKAYRVTGFEDLRGGLIDIGLEVDQITPDDNVELGIANYYSQMEEIDGDKPPTPSGDIMGDDELYLGYGNEYVLGAPNVCTWSVDNTSVLLTDLGGNRCELYCDKTTQINKFFVLTAKIGSMVYEKTIKIVNL